MYGARKDLVLPRERNVPRDNMEQGRDSYILSYLFGYKRKVIGENIGDTGFPKTALNKVKYTLEKNKINYLAIDRSHNYEVEDKIDFKGENKY